MKTVREIAKILAVYPATARKWLRFHGIRPLADSFKNPGQGGQYRYPDSAAERIRPNVDKFRSHGIRTNKSKKGG
jgi:hypothetical protein